MNKIRSGGFPTGRLVWLLLMAVWVIWTQDLRAASMEDHFPVLRTKTGAYTNVTVTTKGDSYIFITHSRGMGSVSVSDLPSEVLTKLGYTVSDSQTRAPSTPAVNAPRHETVSGHVAHKSPRPLPTWLRSANNVLLLICAVALGIYLFYCFCLSLICRKVGSPGGLLIWIPILQWIPMVRAAGMEAGWLFFFYGPMVVSGLAPALTMNGQYPHAPVVLWIICSVGNLIGWIVWCFKIVRAREKHFVFAIFLLLPVTNIFAFLYLAFSSSAPAEKPIRYKSMALETA